MGRKSTAEGILPEGLAYVTCVLTRAIPSCATRYKRLLEMNGPHGLLMRVATTISKLRIYTASALPRTDCPRKGLPELHALRTN